MEKVKEISSDAVHQLIKKLGNLAIDKGLSLLSHEGLSGNALIHVSDNYYTPSINDTLLSFTIRECTHHGFLTPNMLQTIKTTLASGTDPNIYDHRYDSPLTDLVFRTVNVDCIRLLLKDFGANPNVPWRDSSCTPLYYICKGLCGSYGPIPKLLLEYGAKMTHEEEQSIMNAVNPFAKDFYKKELEQAIEKAKQENER